jgi:hypothetical protein
VKNLMRPIRQVRCIRVFPPCDISLYVPLNPAAQVVEFLPRARRERGPRPGQQPADYGCNHLRKSKLHVSP